MKEIMLTKGLLTMVDDWRYEELNRYSWYASGIEGQERAARRVAEIQTRPLIYMSHAVFGIMPWNLPPGKIIDHADRNPLNNQEHNLALVTYAENQYNTKRSEKRSGLSFDNTHQKWKAYIDIPTDYGKRRENVGTFATREEAFLARHKRLLELGLSR